jgi:hypothetical protein
MVGVLIQFFYFQVLIITSLIVAGWENIRLRGLLSKIAKFKYKQQDKEL